MKIQKIYTKVESKEQALILYDVLSKSKFAIRSYTEVMLKSGEYQYPYIGFRLIFVSAYCDGYVSGDLFKYYGMKEVSFEDYVKCVKENTYSSYTIKYEKVRELYTQVCDGWKQEIDLLSVSKEEVIPIPLELLKKAYYDANRSQFNWLEENVIGHEGSI